MNKFWMFVFHGSLTDLFEMWYMEKWFCETYILFFFSKSTENISYINFTFIF